MEKEKKESSPVQCAVALGSNYGKGLEEFSQQIQHATRLLNAIFTIQAVSSLYLSSPTDYLQQSNFLNAVVLFSTVKSCEEVFSTCREIEKTMKSVKLIKKGPRIIDLDLILYGDTKFNGLVNGNLLHVPHKSYGKRLFVLMPLAECEEKMNIRLLHPDRNTEPTTAEIMHQGRRKNIFNGQSIEVYRKKWISF